MKKIAITITILLSCATCIAALPDTTLAVGTETINATNNSIARLVGDNASNNSPALQKILDTAATRSHTTIHIPAGVYAFSGVIQMRSNVTINFAPGAKFSSRNYASFSYLSNQPGYDGGVQNVTWNNPYFDGREGTTAVSSSMLHAKNITFNNPTWYRAQGQGDHLIDMLGSSFIMINNPQVIGTTNAYFRNPSSYYKEAFQISHATKWSYGGPALQSSAFDDLPSSNVTIKDGLFTASYDSAGNLTSYAPSPIGEHGNVANMQISNVTFTGNSVVDPAPGSQKNWALGTIHFMATKNLTITNNSFEYRRAPTNEYVISLESYANTANTLPTQNVIISNNTFKNVTPTKAYIYAVAAQKNGSRNTISDVAITDNTVFLANPAVHQPFVARTGQQNIHNLTERNNTFKPYPQSPTQKLKKQKLKEKAISRPKLTELTIAKPRKLLSTRKTLQPAALVAIIVVIAIIMLIQTIIFVRHIIRQRRRPKFQTK